MTTSFIKYAFISGELSPTLYGRTDLEKYDLAMERISNWYVDYRGGLSTRPGTVLGGEARYPDTPSKFFKFIFGPQLENTYLVIFEENTIRFIQDGGYVLEAAKTVTGVSQFNPGVVTAVGHGYATDDLVYVFDVNGMAQVNDRLFRVGGTVTANTFSILKIDGTTINTTGYDAYTGTGTVQRVYSIEHPYDMDDLYTLRAFQIRDTLRLTHPSWLTRNLTRHDHTDWTLEIETFGNEADPVENVVITPSSVGVASVGFIVTWVDQDGFESRPSDMAINSVVVNYTATAGSVTVTWDGVEGAKYYNVYRTLVLPGPSDGTSGAPVVSKAETVGFVGQSFAPRFVDQNIIPDFTRTPPIYDNPFAYLGVETIDVTAGGTGYTVTDTVTVTGAGATGSGFDGFPIVDDSGAVIAVYITRGGSGYNEPVTITFSGGTGAAATATISPSEDFPPRVSTVFQQRQIYAGSNNDPLTIWGSIPGFFSIFDVSSVIADDDAFEFEIDSAQVAPIEHLVVARGGLLVLTQYAIWQLRGDGTTQAVTPTSAIADPQNYRGCSPMPPLIVDTDILHFEGRDLTAHLLGYNDITKVYAGQEISILSNHLFTATNKVVSWDYASNPYKVVWGCRTDGSMLAFTLNKEQQVYAWAPSYTRGQVQDICVIPENGLDTTYLAVRRKINGKWVKFFERFHDREFTDVEEAFCVDCGLSTTLNYPNATLTIAAASGESVAFTTSASAFSSGDVGSVIRGGGCKAVITDYINSTHVTCTIERDVTAVIFEDGTPLPLALGDWSLDEPFDTVGGLWHLIGETVEVLADGGVLTPKIVDVNGEIDLGVEATLVHVGLKFRPVARTLPLTYSRQVIENRRKRVVEIAANVNKTRGLKWGDTLDDLYEVKERTDEDYNAPTRLQNGNQFVTINAGFDDTGQVYLVQDYPLPATVVGLVLDVEVGDDPK
jgi:hypothetical protein